MPKIPGAPSRPPGDRTPAPEPVATLAPPRSLRKTQPPRGDDPKKKKRTFWRKFWLVTQISAALFVVAACIAGYFVYQQGLIYYGRAQAIDLKKLDDLNVTSTFYDVNGEELGRIFVEDRIILTPDQIPPILRQAVMSAEDRRFYEHGAIDYWGILRALREDLTKKSHGVQGGSSIEQQLAKHLIGDFSRTLDRKFLEAFLAERLERNFTKDQILNYYMNRIYFGKGYFGVEAAAQGYFGVDVMKLTVPQCAMLAGIIRAPTSSSPRVDPGKAKWRRDVTLRQMAEGGYISKEDLPGYLATPVRVIPAKPAGLQSYVMAAAVKEMEQILSVEGTEEMPQGLKVHTNINLRLQRAIEDQMNHRLADLEGPNVDPTKGPLQGSALVADLATGRVLAWVGGRDFSKNQFDHVSMAKRENGSLLEPVLYTLAFDRLNLHPSSMINASFLDPSAPATADDVALGNPSVDLTKRFLSVQDALALGNKAAATRVGVQLGPHAVSEWLRDAGVDVRVPDDKPNTFNPDPMTLADISSLYQAIGNNGLHRKFKIIQSIESRTGDLLYDDTKPDRDDGKDQILNTLDCQQMSLTLENALRSGFARTLTRDYGFKSALGGMPGYSEGYRDAWFVGYTPKLLGGVWIGYDDSRPIGSKDAALKSAVPLWGDMMQEVEARVSGGGPFPVPPELSKVEMDRNSGELRGLAGLAPAPGDIFVYLKKDQIETAGMTPGPVGQQITAPREWSDWLTTMFNQADETGLSDDDQFLTPDKRTNIIPPLAEYKMPGLRGDVLSSDGTVYATTTSEKNLVLSWPDATDATADGDIIKWMRTRLDEVNQVIGVKVDVPDADLISEYRTLRYQPFLVLENITPAQVGQLQAAGLESKGFGFQTAPLRNYPRGPELAHVLGYLSRAQQRNKGKYLSGDIIYDRYKGAAGIEQVCDDTLTGKDGRFMISTSPDGYARSAAVAEAASYGHNVRLTIDSKIQAATELALNQKKLDAAVIMDVHTGDIVAMASHPTFDPNLFVPAISADEWNVLNGDPFNPLINRSIHAEYPPGSSFKTITSIAAMAAGVFDPNWVVHCTGSFDIGNVHMDLKDEHGDVTYLDAFTYSYNTYFMELGLKVGRDILLDTARSFNLGNLTNIILPGELPGLIPDNEFVKRVHGREFGPGDLANTSIGQGDVLVTPVQMVSVMTAIANGGTIYRPRLIKQIEDRDGTVLSTTPVETLRTVTFDENHMPALRQAMINVVDEGTAKVVHRDDMKIAAKTGTAQVGSKEHRRQIAWLSGYFPADNPQYAFSVMVEGQFSDNRNDSLTGGLLGGVDAGSIVKSIMDSMYNKKPDGTAETPSTRAEPEASVAAAPAKTDDQDVPTTPPKVPVAPIAPTADAPTTEVHAKAPPVEAGPATTP